MIRQNYDLFKEINDRAKRRNRSLAWRSAWPCCAALPPAPSFFEIPIETPIQPKMDVSPFQRVLVAGFIGGGTEDVDANLETVRLLRSQLRSKSTLRVIEADALPLAAIAPTSRAGARRRRSRSRRSAAPAAPPTVSSCRPSRRCRTARRAGAADADARIRNEKDLEKYQGIFANTAFWKKLGEEYQNPLIVTGTVLFTPHADVRLRHVRARSLRSVRPPPRRAGPHLHGAQGLHPAAQVHLHRRPHRRDAVLRDVQREVLYNAQQNTPALSSYFELMDRLMPSFLNALSTQKIRGTRVLLK